MSQSIAEQSRLNYQIKEELMVVGCEDVEFDLKFDELRISGGTNRG